MTRGYPLFRAATSIQTGLCGFMTAQAVIGIVVDGDGPRTRAMGIGFVLLFGLNQVVLWSTRRWQLAAQMGMHAVLDPGEEPRVAVVKDEG